MWNGQVSGFQKLLVGAVVVCGIGLVFPGGGVQAAEASSPLVALGNLNGTALACGQQALTNRIRDLVVNVAPKSREVGEEFEAATTAGFLKQGAEGAVCPDGKSLAEQIDAEAARLKSLYPSNP